MLWFLDEDIDRAYARAGQAKAEILEALSVNRRARHREFWLRDPDGYVVAVAGPYGDLSAPPRT